MQRKTDKKEEKGYIDDTIEILKKYQKDRVTTWFGVSTKKLHSEKTNQHKDEQVLAINEALAALKQELKTNSDPQARKTAIFNFCVNLQNLIRKELNFEVGDLERATLLGHMLSIERRFMRELLVLNGFDEFIKLYNTAQRLAWEPLETHPGHEHRKPIDNRPAELRKIWKDRALEELKQNAALTTNRLTNAYGQLSQLMFDGDVGSFRKEITKEFAAFKAEVAKISPETANGLDKIYKDAADGVLAQRTAKDTDVELSEVKSKNRPNPAS